MPSLVPEEVKTSRALPDTISLSVGCKKKSYLVAFSQGLVTIKDFLSTDQEQHAKRKQRERRSRCLQPGTDYML